MSSTLLEPPPSEEGTPTERSEARPMRPRPRRRDEHVLPWAMLLAVLIHLVALLVFRFDGPGLRATGSVATPMAAPEGMRVLRIVEVPSADVSADAPDLPEEQIIPRAVRPPAAAPDAPPTVRADDPTRSIVDRISPVVGDERLFTDPGPAMPAPVNAEALARERFLARIDEFNASSAAAAEAAARALDWTYTDDDGKKWGFSPGKIHLGGLTLPLPIGFAPPPGRREELADRNRRFGEIEGQRMRESGRASFDDRVKAIRERTEAKRDSTRRSGGGS